MTKNNAIELLNRQITKLESTDIDFYSWNIQTITYLESFFGKNSMQGDYFTLYYWNVDSAVHNDVDINDQKNKATGFLNDCIDTIQNLGLYKKPPSGNFISRLSDKWAVTLFVGSITFSFWLGTVFG